uniref:C-type lectin domain-containing protein n=1 Tax=Syphacia muris TaxID=451379 RepID=A0A0N5AC45_9BILA
MRLPLIVLCSLTIFIPIKSQNNNNNACGGGVRGASNCFYRSDGSTNYFNAVRSCALAGRCIATIKSQTDAAAVRRLTSGSSFFLGLRWSEHQWRWFDNDAYPTYTRWAAGQPNNDHTCVQGNSPSTGQWSTSSCSAYVGMTICQAPLPSGSGSGSGSGSNYDYNYYYYGNSGNNWNRPNRPGPGHWPNGPFSGLRPNRRGRWKLCRKFANGPGGGNNDNYYYDVNGGGNNQGQTPYANLSNMLTNVHIIEVERDRR